MENWLSADNLVAWLQRFVRYPSQQTALHEADPHVVGFIKECVAPLMTELGLAHRFDAMGNLVCEVGPRSDKSLLFAAYAMTHPASNMSDPFAATVIDTPRGKAVRGRGVAEQKSALAAALAAVAQAAKGGTLKGRVVFTVLTAGETGRHDAMAKALAALDAPPRYAVVCIGTGNRIAVGNKGRVDFSIAVKGKASHSSTPWDGINALNGAWRVLQTIETLKLDVPPHPQFGPATITTTAIDSRPKATHTIQDTALITGDRRLLPGEDAEDAFRRIAAAVTLGAPWKLEWTRGPVMYPNEISLTGPLYGHFNRAYERAKQKLPEPLYCSFALDAGLFGHQGIEAVMLGPGDIEQFHSDEEFVPIDDLKNVAAIYHHLIETALGG